MQSFSELPFLPEIKKALKEKGYTKPTPIQAKTIPFLMDGKDVLGIAQTGTGKTAAFSLPILQKIAENPRRLKGKTCRALILTPTRELASQITANISEYSAKLKVKTKTIYGGVGINPQAKALLGGIEIVVATPGRLLDLLNNSYIDLSQVEFFVLDEADRMLDMGFIHDVKKIISHLPKKRQNLLFSATMPKDIEGLASEILVKPERVAVSPESSTVDKIQQSLYLVSRDNKLKLLEDILKLEETESALVFSRTKHGADKIVRKLAKASIEAAAIHGNKSQNNRERSLARFKKGDLKVLIATDIAARGIDIENLSHVINFNIPEDPKTYVHRIGRTARAGKEGKAISICDENELNLIKGIEKQIKQKIPLVEDHPYHEVLKYTPRVRQQRGSRPTGKKSRR